MSIVNRRRNIFINSEQYHKSNGDVNLIFPSVDFTVSKNEVMRISLESFTMPRRFYNINMNNNTFYIRDKTNALFHECKIEEGDYASSTLAPAIKASIVSGFSISDEASVTVSISDTTRKIKIDISDSTGWTANHEFVCFQVPPERVKSIPDNNNVITPTGLFNDSCEILGAAPTKDFSKMEDIVPAFSPSTLENGKYIFYSKYPYSLETLEALHIMTNLQTHSYQTPNFIANSEASSLIPSSIFAKIPISHENKITFTDSGSDAYAVDLQNKSINSITLSLRDDKGRRLPTVDSSGNQYKDGNLSFLATLKWCAISTPERGAVSGYLTDNLQMNLYNN